MVFPEEQPASLMKRFKNFFGSFFSGSSEAEQLKPLSFTIAQETSLSVFLDVHFSLLKSFDSPASDKMPNLEKFVNKMYQIYEQLRKRQTIIKKVKDEDWVAKTIAKV